MTDNPIIDLAIIGAGPCGLSAGVAARQAGLSATIFDAGCVTQSIFLYPTYATFFSTADRLELGGVPFIVTGDKPSRQDALKYYRRIAHQFELDVQQYHEVVAIEGRRGDFRLLTRRHGRENREYRARNVVVATGYAGNPVYIDVPGEELPKVRHYFDEGHPYYDQDVIVIGAANSAVEAALASYRAGARVTLVHFLDRLDRGVKPWILPDIENRLQNGEIDVRWNTRVAEILPDRVRLRHEHSGDVAELPNDFVLAMTGYRPDPGLLRSLGVSVPADTGIPAFDPATMETDVPGVFIAGVIAGGNRPDKVFIEDGRHHGPLAVRHILATLGREPDRDIALGVPAHQRAVDLEADGIRSAEEVAGEATGPDDGASHATPDGAAGASRESTAGARSPG